MKEGKRFGLSAEQKSDVWRRWKSGQTLHEIGRAFGKEHSSIRCLVSRHGGIAPAVRRRALLALTLREREEISRGLASGASNREIAKCLERAVSTVSREVARHGGRPAYQQSSGRRSLAVGLAAQALPSFHQPEVAERRCE
jgi:IS30 family transposase